MDDLNTYIIIDHFGHMFHVTGDDHALFETDGVRTINVYTGDDIIAEFNNYYSFIKVEGKKSPLDEISAGQYH